MDQGFVELPRLLFEAFELVLFPGRSFVICVLLRSFFEKNIFFGLRALFFRRLSWPDSF